MLMYLQFRIENSLTSVTFYVFFAVVLSFLKKTKNKNKTKQKNKKTSEGAIITCFVICE